MENHGKREKLPVIALTMGDPAGIGPEIVVKVLSAPAISRIRKKCIPLIIGSAEILRDLASSLGERINIRLVADVSNINDHDDAINLLDPYHLDLTKVTYGRANAESGRAAFEYIKKAVELAMRHAVDAIVTGPVSKESLSIAGLEKRGHTEILANLTGTRDYAMMLVSGHMKVVHVTTHVSLKEVSVLITKERVLKVIFLANSAMKALKVKLPRIGVAGLNPHAGDGGLFGTEEIDEIIPAIEEAKKCNVNVDGPIPPDTVFAKLRGGYYDVVVAMYHDQGHIPLKTLGFVFSKDKEMVITKGVNITLGLPIVRTSVDHGTAFDIVGKGIANADSLLQAIEFAVRLVKGKLIEQYRSYEQF